LKKIFILLLLLYLPLAYGSLEIFAYYDYSFGQVTGFTQIPRGGSLGTTSFEAPTFKDSNIKHDSFYEAGVGIQFDHYFALLDYWDINPRGTDLLQQNLITHNHFIPANSEFKMELNYQWYRLGLGKEFPITDKLTFSPILYGGWLQFLYEFYAYPANSSRFFTLLSVLAGIQLEYHFTEKLTGFIEACGTLPLSHLEIFTGKMGLSYEMIKNAHFKLLPSLGVTVLQIDYEDTQFIPNHFRYTAKPHVTLGFIMVLS